MIRNILNAVMVLLFLTLLNYRFTSNRLHEIFGIAFFVLTLWHNVFNRRWYKGFFSGKQNIRRILMTTVNLFFLTALFAVIVSGVLISRYILLPSSPLHVGNTLWVHSLHQGSAYAGFILMGIHMGMHWEMIWKRMKRWIGIETFKKNCVIIGHVLAVSVIMYGTYASFVNHIGSMLLMQHVFISWGKAPSAMQMFVDYFAIFSCYTAVTHYMTSMLGQRK